MGGQRIIPTDRQNIGEILRDNQLEEYDEYELLMLAMGRCASFGRLWFACVFQGWDDYEV